MSEIKADAEEGINMNMSELKEGLVEKMNGVVAFLEGAPVCNVESIFNLNKHFDKFMLSLKYLPIKNSFDDLPMEIKTKILDYLCDDKAFVAASVCEEWKKILGKRIYKNMNEVVIGRHCKNWYKDECFNPDEMLKAFLVLKLNIPLSVCHPIEEVDSALLAKALTSAPEFTLDDTCQCCVVEMLDIKDKAILTKEQGEELMKALEVKSEPMEKVVLKGLDLTYLKDKMLSCFLKKVKTLTLTHGRHYAQVLNFSSLAKKLRQNSAGRKLERLNLYFEYPRNRRLSPNSLIDALCTIEKVDLGENFYVNPKIAKQIITNMSAGVSRKTLIIRSLKNWRNLLSPTELRAALSKMEKMQLEGKFSLEQLEVARSLPRGYTVKRSGSLYTLGIN